MCVFGSDSSIKFDFSHVLYIYIYIHIHTHMTLILPTNLTAANEAENGYKHAVKHRPLGTPAGPSPRVVFPQW